jgi:hypothetical protein
MSNSLERSQNLRTNTAPMLLEISESERRRARTASFKEVAQALRSPASGGAWHALIVVREFDSCGLQGLSAREDGRLARIAYTIRTSEGHLTHVEERNIYESRGREGESSYRGSTAAVHAGTYSLNPKL